MESADSSPRLSDSPAAPQKSRWLPENLNEIDQNSGHHKSESSLSLSSDSDSENGGYEILLGRIANYEEETARLKDELKKNDSLIKLKDNLQTELDSSRKSIEIEREKAVDLQKLVTRLEKQVFDSNFKIENLEEELEKTKNKLDVSNEANRRLQAQIESKISIYKSDISKRDHLIGELNAALSEAQEQFSTEKEKFESKISSLIEQFALLESRTRDWESKFKSKEDEIVHLKARISEMKDLHEAEKAISLDEIEELKNEKDGFIAKLQELIEENRELVLGLENEQKQTIEMRTKLFELEREVEKQRILISDRDEEKREAIRQLCLSLEHYRSCYQELREAWLWKKKKNRQATVAS